MPEEITKNIKPGRMQEIEFLRIVAAFGIVSYHAKSPFHDLAYSGLIIFLVLSPMLDTKYNWERVRTIISLAKSLLVPWVFWMVVYGVINKLQHKPLFPDGWSDILYGTSAHLWFLPFMFMVLATINLMKPYSPNFLFWPSAIVAAGLLATVSVWRPASGHWLLPLPQWIHAAVPVLFGVVLGLLGRTGSSRLIALLVLTGGLIVADLQFIPGVTIPYTVGILLTGIMAFFSARLIPRGWSVQPVSACMMGVYLCHSMFLKVVGAVIGKANYLTAILTFAISLGVVWLIRRTVPSSKLVLG